MLCENVKWFNHLTLIKIIFNIAIKCIRYEWFRILEQWTLYTCIEPLPLNCMKSTFIWSPTPDTRTPTENILIRFNRFCALCAIYFHIFSIWIDLIAKYHVHFEQYSLNKEFFSKVDVSRLFSKKKHHPFSSHNTSLKQTWDKWSKTLTALLFERGWKGK